MYIYRTWQNNIIGIKETIILNYNFYKKYTKYKSVYITYV